MVQSLLNIFKALITAWQHGAWSGVGTVGGAMFGILCKGCTLFSLRTLWVYIYSLTRNSANKKWTLLYIVSKITVRIYFLECSSHRMSPTETTYTLYIYTCIYKIKNILYIYMCIL